MLTPRRFLLFILAVGGFAAAYLVYSQALGAVDGLPALPARFLTEASGQPVVVNPPVPPTDIWLRQAFGDDALEVRDTLHTYKTRFRKRDSGMAVACGAVDPNGTKFVTVSPISVALFGRPSTQPKTGEVQDISTFHADKAILEFDRPVTSLQELNDKATLVGLKDQSAPFFLSGPGSQGVSSRYNWLTKRWSQEREMPVIRAMPRRLTRSSRSRLTRALRSSSTGRFLGRSTKQRPQPRQRKLGEPD